MTYAPAAAITITGMYANSLTMAKPLTKISAKAMQSATICPLLVFSVN